MLAPTGSVTQCAGVSGVVDRDRQNACENTLTTTLRLWYCSSSSTISNGGRFDPVIKGTYS